MSKTFDFEFDHLVVGSGFGGSVAAMRLAQKGIYGRDRRGRQALARRRVPPPELEPAQVPLAAGLRALRHLRLRLLDGIFILAGAGVGGGSLNYANTLYVPPDVFFERPSVRRLGGKAELLPYYELAARMLGAVENPVETAQDALMKETAAEIGRRGLPRTNVAVYFGKEGEPAADPYFDGEGPDRIGCELCGECMTGCRKTPRTASTRTISIRREVRGPDLRREQGRRRRAPLAGRSEG